MAAGGGGNRTGILARPSEFKAWWERGSRLAEKAKKTMGESVPFVHFVAWRSGRQPRVWLSLFVVRDVQGREFHVRKRCGRSCLAMD